MQTQTPQFDIWVDGSYIPANGQSGAGILFTDELGEREIAVFSVPTSHILIENSIQAEMIAATQALQLAKTFAEITAMKVRRLHCDNEAVIRFLNEKYVQPDFSARQNLQLVCANLQRAFEECGGVTIAYASDKRQALLKKADRLAGNATTVPMEDSLRLFNASGEASSETSVHSTGGKDDSRVPSCVLPTLPAPSGH